MALWDVTLQFMMDDYIAHVEPYMPAIALKCAAYVYPIDRNPGRSNQDFPDGIDFGFPRQFEILEGHDRISY